MSIASLMDRATYKIELAGGQGRLKEAILYVANQARGMQFFGAVKLNKILWRADFKSFFERAQPVTGRQYQRLKQGPAPVEMPPVFNEMLKERLVKQELRPAGLHTEHRPVALVEPNLRLFSPEDLEYLDESVRHYWLFTGTEASDQSHGIAWKTRVDGEPIPYQAAYFEDAPLSKASLAKLASRGGLRSE